MRRLYGGDRYYGHLTNAAGLADPALVRIEVTGVRRPRTPPLVRARRQALGIAILGTVLFTTVAVSLDSGLDDLGVPEAARTGIVNAVVDSAGGAIPALATDPRTASAAPVAQQAFSDATRYAAFTAAGFLVLGLLATLSLGDRPRGRHTQGSAAQAGPAQTPAVT